MLSFRTREKMGAARLDSVAGSGVCLGAFQGVARAVKTRTRQVCRNSALHEATRLSKYIEIGVESEQQVVVLPEARTPVAVPAPMDKGSAGQVVVQMTFACKVYGTNFRNCPVAHRLIPRKRNVDVTNNNCTYLKHL